MNFKYIDIHSHLNLNQFDADRGEVINKMKDESIATITVGVDYLSSKMAIELAEVHDNLYACVGMHPADNSTEIFDYDKMLELAKHEKVVAIGECGFDYFRDQSESLKVRQKEIFLQHIKLAEATGKPLMIHARPEKGSMDAYEDTLEILKEFPNVKANFHFFVGDMNIAKVIVERGYTVSFDGPITFTSDYDEIIKFIPIENIMAETDAPFAAPAPYRGKRCEPWMVVEVVKKIGGIKGLSTEEVDQTLLSNAKRAFGI